MVFQGEIITKKIWADVDTLYKFYILIIAIRTGKFNVFS